MFDAGDLHGIANRFGDGTRVVSANRRGPVSNTDDPSGCCDASRFLVTQIPPVIAVSLQPSMRKDHWALRLFQHVTNRRGGSMREVDDDFAFVHSANQLTPHWRQPTLCHA